MLGSRENLKALHTRIALDVSLIMRCERPELLEGGAVISRGFTCREKSKPVKRFIRICIESAREWVSYPPVARCASVLTTREVDAGVFDHTQKTGSSPLLFGRRGGYSY